MSVVDGIVSGLDTTSLINQLLSIERAPITRMQTKQAAADKKIQAWKDIASAVSTLRTATQALAKASTFTTASATSSDPTVATATVRTGASAASASFKVVQLASADSIMTTAGIGASGDLAGAGRAVAGLGLQALGVTGLTVAADATAAVSDVSVTAAGGSDVLVRVGDESVTVDRNATSVEIGGLTMSIGPGGLVDGAGKVQVVATTASSTIADFSSSFSVVRSSILSLGTGANPDRRLVFASPTTGAANQVMVASTGLGPALTTALGTTSVLNAGQDAKLDVGGGVVVQRSTNTMTDVFDGVDLQLVKAAPDTTVTVAASLDTTGITASVKQWVNAMNGALNLIDSKSGYDSSTNTGGVLLGDSSARSVRQMLVSSMGVSATEGTYRNLPQLGISVDTKGRYTLDETKLAEALASDAGAVAKLFARSATTTDDAVSFSSAGEAARPGTYAIEITTPAARAEAVGDAFTALGGDETLTFTLGSRTVDVTLTEGQAISSVADAINAAFRSTGISAKAEIDGGALRVRSNNYGSRVVLSVLSTRTGADSTGLAGPSAGVATEYAGVDVAGTIDGVEASGSGQSLTGMSGKAEGLRLLVTATAAGALGSVTYDGGVAGSLARMLGTSGNVDLSLTTATNSLSALKRDYDDRISAYQDRLTQTEARLRRQFTQMETLLAQLRGQGTRLTSALQNGVTSTQNG